jgi:hypothetical protein
MVIWVLVAVRFQTTLELLELLLTLLFLFQPAVAAVVLDILLKSAVLVAVAVVITKAALEERVAQAMLLFKVFI